MPAGSKPLPERNPHGERRRPECFPSNNWRANLRRKAGYTYTFLSDPKLEVIRLYDLLHVAGGPDGHDISRPAEFLVDRAGIVRWENFTEDVRVRPRAEEMLAAALAVQ